MSSTSITSTGIGSGIGISALVSSLVSAEGQPQLNLLAKQEATLTNQLSAVGSLSGALSSFQNSLSGLSNLSSFQALTATSSNTSLYTATAATGASVGTHNVEVDGLASAQQIASGDIASVTAPVGTGTLTFQFGSYDSTGNTFTPNTSTSSGSVTIDASNNSLQGIAATVNKANVGVSASIVNDGTGNRLIFSSMQSGAANTLKVTVGNDSDSNSTDNVGLSQLAYDPTATVGAGKNMTQTTAAANASLMVDGIAMTSPTNTVTGAIPGVTLNLLSSSPKNPSTLSVGFNTSTVTSSIQSFVTAYNSLYTTMQGLGSYNAATQTGGPLLGDSTLLNISNQIQATLGNAVANLGGSYNSLASLGVTTQRDGTLSLDSTALSNALNQNPNAVGLVFAASGTTTDAQVSYGRSTSATIAGSYAVNITQAATQGKYVAAAPTSPNLTIDNTNNTFAVSVNGIQSSPITLDQKTYASNADLATAMQTSINNDATLKAAGLNVTVGYDTDHFVISSPSYGSVSSVGITSASAGVTSTLGLGVSVGTGTKGQDVAGTIGGQAATGFGQLLTGATGPSTGLQIQVQGSNTGTRGNAVFSRGVADQMNTLISSFLDPKNGFLTYRTNEINTNIAHIDTKRTTVNANLSVLQAQYLAKYNAMDSLVASLKSTGDYLTKQFGGSSSSSSGG